METDFIQDAVKAGLKQGKEVNNLTPTGANVLEHPVPPLAHRIKKKHVNHNSPNQACSCCHRFQPAAECYWTQCGGGYCWSKHESGIHWGWGSNDKTEGYDNGADECTVAQKSHTCKAHCLKDNSCDVYGTPGQ